MPREVLRRLLGGCVRHGVRQVIVLLEQVIRDEVSGITFYIWRTPDGEGRLRLQGDFPYGNRDLHFAEAGRHGDGRGRSVPAPPSTRHRLGDAGVALG